MRVTLYDVTSINEGNEIFVVKPGFKTQQEAEEYGCKFALETMREWKLRKRIITLQEE